MLIKKKIKKVLSKIRKKIILRKIDVFLISYPKSGRTWLRIVLGKYLNDLYHLSLPDSALTEVQTFFRYNKKIPRFEIAHNGDPHFTHYQNIFLKFSRFKKSKIVFLYRDPRPTSVSYYYHYKYRIHEKIDLLNEIEDNIDTFILNPIGGIDSCISYLNIWAEFYSLNNEILLIGYEDLLKSTEQKLIEILKHIDIDINSNLLRSAIQYGSYENLALLEIQNKLNKGRFGGTNEKNRKVRVGKKQEWHEDLKLDTVNIINKKVHNNLNNIYGYK